MFYLFQPLLSADFVNALFTSGVSHNSNNPPRNGYFLVDIYVWDLYVYGWDFDVYGSHFYVYE
jgi:hypothetical protein